MRHILFVLLLCISPIIAGCPPEVIPYRAESSIERSYKLGETRTARPGETMVSLRQMTTAPLYEVAFDYAPPQHDVFQGGLDYPALIKGARFAQVATRGDGLIGLSRPDYGVTRAARGSRETFLPVIIWIDKDGVVSTSMEGKAWTQDRLFLPTARSGAAVEASRTELVFEGVNSTLIEATHKVYAGEAVTTRPVRFDLDDGRTITFLNFTIEVLSATPAQLEYRVLRDE